MPVKMPSCFRDWIFIKILHCSAYINFVMSFVCVKELFVNSFLWSAVFCVCDWLIFLILLLLPKTVFHYVKGKVSMEKYWVNKTCINDIFCCYCVTSVWGLYGVGADGLRDRHSSFCRAVHDSDAFQTSIKTRGAVCCRTADFRSLTVCAQLLSHGIVRLMSACQTHKEPVQIKNTCGGYK